MHRDRHTHREDPANARFLRLFLASEPELFRYVAVLVPNAQEAEEVVQQTAILLWEKFDEYDPNRPFTPWACRFALNVAKQWMAQRDRWRGLLETDLPDELLRRRRELLPEFDDRLVHLTDCIDKLPSKERYILDRFYFEREPVPSIARGVQRSVDAVYKSLQRIRHTLRVCIERAVHREAGIS